MQLMRSLTVFLLIFSARPAVAQLRNYGLVYSDNAKGDVAVLGNTLMALAFYNTSTINTAAMNDNALTGNSTFTNNFQTMVEVDVDGNTGDGGATRNSSSADLALPSGTNTIKLARLYWGGRAAIGNYDLSLPSNRTIRIRKGTSGSYFEFAAQQFDRQIVNTGTADEYSLFQGYVDITSFVRDNGAGTYTVGNAPLSTGNGGNAGNYGGWTIVVVYENDALPFNSIRVYDGFQEVWSFGTPLTSTVTLTGLDVPSGTLNLSDARMSIMTWEGDANFNQDFLKINGTAFSNAVNPADNPMNGTITKDGVHVTTKNPNYTNQMGIDLDEFNVGTGYGILPNATSVTLQFGTELDQYFPGLFTFVIRMKEPNVSLNKSVSDASGSNTAEVGEVLTYTLKGKNTGVGNANNIIVTDTLPSTVTYVPGSLQINYCPGLTSGMLTDNSGDDVAEYITAGSNRVVQFRLGTNATSLLGGTLSTADSFSVSFQVIVNSPVGNDQLNPITNIARITARSDANEIYTDEGIAIINPAIINLPIVLRNFQANYRSASSEALLTWTTEQEWNSFGFEIERSSNGRNFQRIATIAAAGQSTAAKTYSFTDALNQTGNEVIYYRIKLLDRDGTYQYSPVARITFNLKNPAQISPNPFRDQLMLQWYSDRSKAGTIRIFNLQGATVKWFSRPLIQGMNRIELNQLNDLPAGTYLIQLDEPGMTKPIKINKF